MKAGFVQRVLSAMDIKERILRRGTPVVINSFNQFTYLKGMVERLVAAGFRNVYVLDQASSYPPLLAWLSQVHDSYGVLPIFLPSNMGPHHFFRAGLFMELFDGQPFLYSDPDLSWDELAPDFLSTLLSIAHRHQIFKVGPALQIPEVGQEKPMQYINGQASVAEWEMQFWKDEVEPGIFRAPLDTTFHLFVPRYCPPQASMIDGFRVGRPGFVMKHLPWFADDPMPEEEYRFYIQLSKHSTWFRQGEDAGQAGQTEKGQP